MARSLILGAVDGLILFAGISSAVLRGAQSVEDVASVIALVVIVNLVAMLVAEASQGFREVAEVDEKLVARRRYRPTSLYRRVLIRALREAAINSVATLVAATPPALAYLLAGPEASLVTIYVVAAALSAILWKYFSTPAIFGAVLMALVTLVIMVGKTV